MSWSPPPKSTATSELHLTLRPCRNNNLVGAPLDGRGAFSGHALLGFYLRPLTCMGLFLGLDEYH
jgi:hypothetical protein